MNMQGVPLGVASKRTSAAFLILPVFASALFASAFLLFAVQPLFTKMVLPRLGGSPAVWSVAMVFFQSVLLLGYAYAHALTKWLSPKAAFAVHISMLSLVALLALPITLASGWDRPPVEGETLWLIGLFAVSVGSPFFAVSTNGPLLQAWFARTGHVHADDPYFLYGASNVGSLLALLGYPFLIEPFFGLARQSQLWAMGFSFFTLLVCGAGALFVLSAQGVAMPAATAYARTVSQIAWSSRLKWIALSFVPSGLLVAVTAHISTDIAAAPFIWVVPLALFLLTFIITFQRKPVLPHGLMLRLQPIAFGLTLVSAMGGMLLAWPFALTLHLVAFFIAAMVCHGELVKRRPDAAHLTEFYLCMSVGGVLGGLSAGLIAPQIFSGVAEYPLLLLAALACRPGVWANVLQRLPRESAWALGMAALAGVAAYVLNRLLSQGAGSEAYGMVVFALAIMIQLDNNLRLLLVAATCLGLLALKDANGNSQERVRSFYGVNKVVESSDGRFRILSHGTTLHGAQRLNVPAEQLPEPLTYFYFGGPISQGIVASRQVQDGMLGHVAVIGLGTGSLACHAKANENWRYYEIDKAVADIATGPKARFDFIGRCKPDASIVLGDARLTLADAPSKAFDLIVIDAFSSDAIPSHLLTRKALAGYLEKLSDRGMILFHISNRNIALRDVVGALARDGGLAARSKLDRPSKENMEAMKTPSLAAAVARHPEDLKALDESWKKLETPSSILAWTDDYADLLGAISRKLLHGDF